MIWLLLTSGAFCSFLLTPTHDKFLILKMSLISWLFHTSLLLFISLSFLDALLHKVFPVFPLLLSPSDHPTQVELTTSSLHPEYIIIQRIIQRFILISIFLHATYLRLQVNSTVNSLKAGTKSCFCPLQQIIHCAL